MHLTLATRLENFLSLHKVIFLVFIQVDRLLYSCWSILVVDFIYLLFLIIIGLLFFKLHLFEIILNLLIDFMPLLIQDYLLSVFPILLLFKEVLCLSLWYRGLHCLVNECCQSVRRQLLARWLLVCQRWMVKDIGIRC